MQFVESAYGWIDGEHFILSTLDAGKTWNINQPDYYSEIRGIFFLNRSLRWAVGLNGKIIHTDDGGLKIQFTEGSVAGKPLSITYTQKAPTIVPVKSQFDKPAYYVDVSTAAENFKANLVLKYTDDLVQKQAIKETEIAAAYWDAKDSLWKSVLVSIDTSANTITLTTSHLSLWALVSNKENLITGIDNTADTNALPLTYALYQNYPNPFNSSTTIRFSLPVNQHVTLTIYNILGQSVRRLINSKYLAGEHSITWDGKDDNGISVSSGIYLYQIKTEKFHQTKKLLLLK